MTTKTSNTITVDEAIENLLAWYRQELEKEHPNELLARVNERVAGEFDGITDGACVYQAV